MDDGAEGRTEKQVRLRRMTAEQTMSGVQITADYTKPASATENMAAEDSEAAPSLCIHDGDMNTRGTYEVRPRQHRTKYQRRFMEGTDTESGSKGATAKPEAMPSKLTFTSDETVPDGAAPKLTDKGHSAVSGAKVKAAANRKAAPASSLPSTAKKRHLRFEGENPVGAAKRKGPAAHVSLSANAALARLHSNVRRADDDNIGGCAANETMATVEGAGRTALRARRKTAARKTVKASPKPRTGSYRSFSSAEKGSKAQTTKTAQKRIVKKGHTKAARANGRASPAMRRVANSAKQAAMRTLHAVKIHPAAVAVVAVLVILMLVIFSAFSSCANMGLGSAGSIFASSYLAGDEAINGAELLYTEWETDLLIEVNDAERTHPGYDEYRYSIGDISHSPFELMAFLTAVYQDFISAESDAALREAFDMQYKLEYIPETETRQRTETQTNPVTGEKSEATVSYEWRILNVRIAANSFSDIAYSLMDKQERERYGVLLMSRGNRQYVSNIFESEWLSHISSYYGYRIHPLSGVKDYHKGIDIAFPSGTKIRAGHDGTIREAEDSGSYGLMAVIDGSLPDGSVLTTRYAHCLRLLVRAGQQVKAGDVIAEVGSTGNSTGPHLHLEILVNGRNLNPIYFVETGAPADMGSIPGSSGGPDIPPYPGAPMDDARFEAMVKEAQKHLGKPYVFGASGPSSFDCSGFVCFVLNNSGARSVGRTTAQGLYNMTTPVSAENAKPGDLVFFTRTYSAGTPVTHIGIYLGNGKMIHAGDPVQYADISANYWQQHFYAFGRI
jgi:murein DD-endopeptidase MepM/ murein hydrolase activator NlpD